MNRNEHFPILLLALCEIKRWIYEQSSYYGKGGLLRSMESHLEGKKSTVIDRNPVTISKPLIKLGW